MTESARWLVLLSGLMMAQVSRADATHLELGLGVKCRTVGAESRMDVHVALKNAGTEELVLYRHLGWGMLAGLTLDLSDSSGRPVQPAMLDHDLPVPSQIGEQSAYVTLEGGQFLGAVRSDAVKDLLPKPGMYHVRVLYRSPLPIDSSLVKTGFVSREEGTRQSNVVRVEVLPSGSCRLI